MKTSALVLALATGLFGATAAAQPPLDAPPPIPAETKPSAPAATPTPPASAAPNSPTRRTLARLPESDRAKQDAALPPAPNTEPPDSDLLPPARHIATETHIEQIRQGNRVVEIVVTPQGSSTSYVIVNREGRLPYSTQELSSGLSTPRFLRFDF